MPFVAEVDNRSLKADCTDFNMFVRWKKPKSLLFFSEEKIFFHKSNYKSYFKKSEAINCVTMK